MRFRRKSRLHEQACGQLEVSPLTSAMGRLQTLTTTAFDPYV
jgi:hypothetical protein